MTKQEFLTVLEKIMKKLEEKEFTDEELIIIEQVLKDMTKIMESKLANKAYKYDN